LARGLLLTASIIIFVAGVAWRLWSLWRMPAERVSAVQARQAFGTEDALGEAFDSRVLYVLKTIEMGGVK
jgi:hypothetical protein